MFEPGQILINKYRLEVQLGIGGFAEVWKATDLDAGIEVAVKLFLKQDQQGIDLCRAEFLRVQGLKHASILPLNFFSQTQGVPFIVMRYCEAGTLVKLSGKMSEKRIAQLMSQIASALHYLHNLPKPIVHNDIKPDNILLESDGDFMLSDFGISEELTRRLSKSLAAERRTVPKDSGKAAGETAMAYRPPELFKFGSREKQDPSAASDIWSFAATVYQMAASMPPFDREGGLMENKYFFGPNSTPLQMDDVVQALPEKFSRDLDTLLKRCLSVEPSERPSAEELELSAKRFLKTGTWTEKAPEPVEASIEASLRVSRQHIEFERVKKGQTATEPFWVSGQGLSGPVRVEVTPPYTISTRNETPVRYLDLAFDGLNSTQSLEVHFESEGSSYISGEVRLTHPATGKEVVSLNGRGTPPPLITPLRAIVGAALLGGAVLAGTMVGGENEVKPAQHDSIPTVPYRPEPKPLLPNTSEKSIKGTPLSRPVGPTDTSKNEEIKSPPPNKDLLNLPKLNEEKQKKQ